MTDNVVDLAAYRAAKRKEESVFDPYPFLFTDNAGDLPCDTEESNDEPA
jgi:hypothetical protein